MGIDDTHPDWTLLARVVSGGADERDLARLESWVGDRVDRRAVVEQTRALWAQGGTPTEAVDAELALARIKGLEPRRRVLRFPGGEESAPGEGWRRHVWPIARIVAAGGIAAAAVLWIGAYRGTTTSPARPKISEVSTRRGERAQLKLPDGTQLVLAPASKVRYASDYGAVRREVTLEGQALFTVTHDSAHPFVVRTAHAVATDLGTTFVVRAYAEDRTASVAVTEGKVSVAHVGVAAEPSVAQAILAAGDIANFAADGSLDVRRGAVTDADVAWAKGQLVFRDTPLSEVLKQVSRWFDVDARAIDSVAARRRLTATYSTESLPDILHLVAASLDVRVDRRGRTVTITAARAAHPRGEP